jgi:hypothetical protein
LPAPAYLEALSLTDTTIQQASPSGLTGAPRSRVGVVVQYSESGTDAAGSHESASRAAIARHLAVLKGYAYGGEFEAQRAAAGAQYFVPSVTLEAAVAARLGIATEHDLFGGVVPYAFVGTKTITHPLVDERALAPRGWSHALWKRMGEAVLTGFSAFTLDDARRAGARVLELGAVRLKAGSGVGGREQAVVYDRAALDAVLAATDASEVRRSGLVIEQNLEDAQTYSAGQVRVADLVATYGGVQLTTTDNTGTQVYGGSELLVVRGDYDRLMEVDLKPDVRLAVEQARMYDAAATCEYPGLIASRRNYDIAQGRDGDGRRRSGVLEQSWRIGGASGAEIAALAAFRANAGLRAVRAASIEVYGADAPVPARADIHFRGVDARAGYITKYTIVEAYAGG